MRSQAVCGFHNGKKRTCFGCHRIVSLRFRTLKREIETRHMPPDCHDFIVRHLKAPAKKLYHGLLAMSKGDVGVVDPLHLVLLPRSVLVLAKLLDFYVDFSLAKQRETNAPLMLCHTLNIAPGTAAMG